MIALLPFQRQAVANIQARVAAGAKCVLLQSATASGKTVIAGQFLKEYLAENRASKVLILVNLQVLVGQTYDTLVDFFNIQPAVLHDEIIRNQTGQIFPIRGFGAQVVITMPETFINTRNNQNQLVNDPTWIPDQIIIDEAHKGTSVNYQTIRNWYPDAKILGLTATPYREKNEEGEHLTEWYGDNLITTISIPELIEMGRLVQPNYFEYDENSHVVDTWKESTKHSDNKKTILFTRDTRDSLLRLEAFLMAGIPARIVTSGTDDIIDNQNAINVGSIMRLAYGTPLTVNRDGARVMVTSQTPAQRQEIYKSFENEVDVLISVSALCEGFDSPIAKFCFLCRSVGNHALYHQMIGRCLRAHALKNEAVISDFYGNIAKHGPIETYKWALDAPNPDIKHLGRERNVSLNEYNKKIGLTVRCQECNHVYDIKKHHSCVQCQTRNELTIIGDVSDWIAPFPKLKDKKQFEDFKNMVRKLRGADPKNPAYKSWIGQCNRAAGVELFDPVTGAINPTLQFLKAIANNDLTKKQKYAGNIN
jgi:superfamily II DNA or RNA helicase